MSLSVCAKYIVIQAWRISEWISLCVYGTRMCGCLCECRLKFRQWNNNLLIEYDILNTRPVFMVEEIYWFFPIHIQFEPKWYKFWCWFMFLIHFEFPRNSWIGKRPNVHDFLCRREKNQPNKLNSCFWPKQMLWLWLPYYYTNVCEINRCIKADILMQRQFVGN